MTDAKLPAKAPRALVLASALLPVLLLGGVFYLLFARGTGLYLDAPAPIEKLEFERVVLRPGEIRAHVINTANNLLFMHDIEMAAETPVPDRRMLGAFALLGVYVGVIPVFLGILWLPFLRSLPREWYFFFLSLTAGLLVFLGVDALEDALENAERVPGPFQGVAVILIGLSISLLGLYAITGWLKRRRQAKESSTALLLAYSIAFGIGVHNLGEGLRSEE